MFPKHHTFRHIHKVSLENHLQNHRTPDSGSEGWGFESLPVYHSKNAASEKMQRFFFDFLAFYALHTGKSVSFRKFLSGGRH